MKFDFIIFLSVFMMILVLVIHCKILIKFHVCLLIFQLIPLQVNLLNRSMNSSLTPIFGFSSSASPEPESQNEQDKAAADQTKEPGSILESQSQSDRRKEWGF